MKLSTYAVSIPVGAVTVLLAVANRQDVRFSLDPFSASDPAIAFVMPLYLLVFIALVLGILIGAAVVTVNRGLKRVAAARAAVPSASRRSVLFFGPRGPRSPGR